MNEIITIGRQFGAGGRELGKRLSKELQIPYYDKELLSEAAKLSGLSEKFLNQEDERVTNSLLYSLVMGTCTLTGQPSLEELGWDAQRKAILSVADKGGCIIVGRCADYLLQNKADCLKVFIHADMAFRAKRIVEVYGEREQSPEQRLRDKDKRRAAYHRFYTDMKWGDARNYHIALDSGALGIDKCADMIASLY